MPEKGFFSSAQNVVALVAAIVSVGATAFGVWAQSQAQQSANKASEISRDFEVAKQAFDKLRDENDRIFVVYREVVEALKDESQTRQELALMLIENYLPASATPEMRFKMAGVFRDKTQIPALQGKAAELQYSLQSQTLSVGAASAPQTQAAAAGRPHQLGSFNVDIFWCEGSPQGAERAAGTLANLLARETSGRVRSRILPDAKRVGDFGYDEVGPAQIRLEETDAERPLEAVLRKLTAPSLISSGIVASADEVVLLPVGRTPTPGYVSMFICPGL